MKMWKFGLGIMAVLAVSGCTAETPEGDAPDKSMVLSLGSADFSFDVCEAYGWYGDGECDPFCDLVDSDCACQTESGTLLGEGDVVWSGCNVCACQADGTIECSARSGCTSPHCVSDGVAYLTGESFPDEGSCNTCTCQADGTVICTERDCARVGCTDGGATFDVGESIPGDGCNACTCQESGEFICTTRDCARVGCYLDEEFYDVGNSYAQEDGCNNCTCQDDGDFLCTLRACARVPVQCEYDGSSHDVGDSITVGCNSCTCQASGEFICTLRDCTRE